MVLLHAQQSIESTGKGLKFVTNLQILFHEIKTILRLLDSLCFMKVLYQHKFPLMGITRILGKRRERAQNQSSRQISQ